MVRVIRACHADLHKIVTIDLKSFDYPWQPEVFSQFLKAPKGELLIAVHKTKIVGYIAFVCKEGVATIGRIAVLKKYRRHGIGTSLLQMAQALSKSDKCKTVSLMVPALYCNPGDSDDCSAWLSAKGFWAKEIKKDAYVMFGDDVDGYIFTRSV